MKLKGLERLEGLEHIMGLQRLQRLSHLGCFVCVESLGGRLSLGFLESV